jgi:hypothetical protein
MENNYISNRDQALNILFNMRQMGIPDEKILNLIIECFLSGSEALEVMGFVEDELKI